MPAWQFYSLIRKMILTGMISLVLRGMYSLVYGYKIVKQREAE